MNKTIFRKRTKKSKRKTKRNNGGNTDSHQKKIKSLFEKPKTIRQANFLKTICSDSGQCISFGLEIDRIKQFFHQFDIPSPYIEKDLVRQIGAPSENGFVTEIPYKKESYHAYTILKSAKDKKADNLFYEALVGLYINKKNKIYPCFLETYQIYYYSVSEVYRKMEKDEWITNDEYKTIKKMVKQYNYKEMFQSKQIDGSCKYSKFLCLQIQHLKPALSLQHLLEKLKHVEEFFTVHLVSILYQLYCPLAFLSDEFTHYDLHTNNVLIYNPNKLMNKYVKMVYHYPDNTTVEIKSTFIAKIIDYGRSFFYDKEESIHPKMLYYKLCNTKDCQPFCGEEVGYVQLQSEVIPGSFHYISSQQRNKSHDLRLANTIWNTPGKYNGENSNPLRIILSKIKYMEKYGTPEIVETGSLENIYNVEDMHLALKNLILNEPYFKKKSDEIHSKMEQLGELHVWVDGSKPMTYTNV